MKEESFSFQDVPYDDERGRARRLKTGLLVSSIANAGLVLCASLVSRPARLAATADTLPVEVRLVDARPKRPEMPPTPPPTPVPTPTPKPLAKHLPPPKERSAERPVSARDAVPPTVVPAEQVHRPASSVALRPHPLLQQPAGGNTPPGETGIAPVVAHTAPPPETAHAVITEAATHEPLPRAVPESKPSPTPAAAPPVQASPVQAAVANGPTSDAAAVDQVEPVIPDDIQQSDYRSSVLVREGVVVLLIDILPILVLA